MNLLYTADGHRTDFDESELAELPRLQDVHLTMIAKQDVFLMLKRVLVHGPKRTSDPGMIQSSSMIRMVVMMVITRRARSTGPPTYGSARCSLPRMWAALSECPLTGNF